MAGAQELVAIVEAFFNAIKTVINALKALFGMAEEGSQTSEE